MASSSARSGRSVTSSSTASWAWPSRPAAFSRGASAEGHVLAVELPLAVELRPCASGPGQPQRRALLSGWSSPWRTSTRFSSTSGTTSATVPSGGQPDGLEQEVPHPRARPRLAPLACWQRAQASFKATPAPLRPSNGIVVAGQGRVDDRGGLGQLPAGLVVVGDDQFQAALAGRARLRRRWRCRNRP